MYRDQDNYNDYTNEASYDDYSNCYSCPYFYRELPPRPPFPGGMGHGPMEQGPSAGRPPGPPPSTTPNKNQGVSMYSVSPGSIRPCTYRYVYIWLENGRSFWAWLTRVDRRTAMGYRWSYGRWVYFAVDLRSIEMFQCY